MRHRLLFLATSLSLLSASASAEELPTPASAPASAPAPGYSGAPGRLLAPGTIELRLAPTGPVPLNASFGSGGLSVLLPEQGDSITFFGLTGGVGFLINPMLEPGVTLDLAVGRAAGNTLTVFGFAAFFKLNIWLNRVTNLFFEPSAGMLHYDVANTSDTFFRGGIRFGLEYLFGRTWGISFWTGVGALYHDNYLLEIPLRWGLVGYF